MEMGLSVGYFSWIRLCRINGVLLQATSQRNHWCTEYCVFDICRVYLAKKNKKNADKHTQTRTYLRIRLSRIQVCLVFTCIATFSSFRLFCYKIQQQQHGTNMYSVLSASYTQVNGHRSRTPISIDPTCAKRVCQSEPKSGKGDGNRQIRCAFELIRVVFVIHEAQRMDTTTENFGYLFALSGVYVFRFRVTRSNRIDR